MFPLLPFPFLSELSFSLLTSGLKYAAGETLHVLSTTDCPSGHWLCRNAAGATGYVPSSGTRLLSSLTP